MVNQKLLPVKTDFVTYTCRPCLLVPLQLQNWLWIQNRNSSRNDANARLYARTAKDSAVLIVPNLHKSTFFTCYLYLHLQALFACSAATTKLAVNPRSARLYARTAKNSTVPILPKQGLQSNWRTGRNQAACQRLCTWLVSLVRGQRPEIPTNSIQSS